MFTGIIEALGLIQKIIKNQNSFTFHCTCPFIDTLYLGQSLAHDGVCLTIEKIEKNHYGVTAIKETLEKTTLGQKEIGDSINLERGLAIHKRLDGHIVQGHVDTTAVLKEISHVKDHWNFTFEINNQCIEQIVEKGSISINGISLTCYNIQGKTFQVSIIPHTYLKTNINDLKIGDMVNIELDIIGKYVKNFVKKTILH